MVDNGAAWWITNGDVSICCDDIIAFRKFSMWGIIIYYSNKPPLKMNFEEPLAYQQLWEMLNSMLDVCDIRTPEEYGTTTKK